MTINRISKSNLPAGSGDHANYKPFKVNERLPKSPTLKREPFSGNRQTASLTTSSARKILSPQLRATATPDGPGSAYYANDDLESVFVEEFSSHQKDVNESKARKELKNFTNLPGSKVYPHAENQILLLRRRQRTTPSTTYPGDIFRNNSRNGGSVPVRHHTMSLKKEPSTSLDSFKSTKDGRHKLLFTPYVEVNAKISRVLQHAKPRVTSKAMQASKLDEYHRLVTKETAAAIILQSQIRRVLAAERCKILAFRWNKATMIQCLVRSHFARMRMFQLLKEKEWASGVRIQFVRVCVSRYRRRKRIEQENHGAVVCQCAIRVHFAKKITKQMRLQLSWELNQRRWRTISIRLAWANNRVNFLARKIQCVVRRELAQRRVRYLGTLYTQSSTLIQACWRRYIARKQMSTMMYHLNVEVRFHNIRMITSEHRYWRDKVEELASKPQQKKNLDRQRIDLEKGRSDLRDKIHALELHFRDQTELMTPQNIACGWEEQIRVNLRDVRERITKAKLELFFDVERKLKSVAKVIDEIQRTEDEAKHRMEHWGACLDDENEALRHYQRQHDQELEDEEKRQGINHERMVWAVKFRMPSGKPDKRRPLVSRFLETDCGHSSLERIRQLIDAAKLKADRNSTVNHLSNSFQPFQNMWDRFNSLNLDDFMVKRVEQER